MGCKITEGTGRWEGNPAMACGDSVTTAEGARDKMTAAGGGTDVTAAGGARAGVGPAMATILSGILILSAEGADRCKISE